MANIENDHQESRNLNLKQFIVWRGELVPEEIKSLASCKSVSSEAVIVDWRMQDYEAGEDGVEIEESAPLTTFCDDDPARQTALFNVGAPKAEYDTNEGQV